MKLLGKMFTIIFVFLIGFGIKANNAQISSLRSVGLESTEDKIGITIDAEQDSKATDIVRNSDTADRVEKMSQEDIDAKYRAYLTEADDPYDYKWANDYSDYVFGMRILDSSSYERIFGFAKPTETELVAAIDKNKKIPDKYKSFLKDLVRDWLSLYPESDFSVFMANLESLNICELSPSKIQIKAANIGTVACYVSSENTIYVREGIDFSERSSDDYIVLAHETMHAARTANIKDEHGNVRYFKFFENPEMGLYEDEAIETYFVYQMQNLGYKSHYYCLQSSIYRQFLPYMDYDGSDYMNHQLNFFIQQLDEYLDEIGVETEAYHLVNLIDGQAKDHYTSYATTAGEFTDFSELYEALSRSYQYQHNYWDMTEEEKQQAFEDFYQDITYNFENLSDPYPSMTREDYLKYW